MRIANDAGRLVVVLPDGSAVDVAEASDGRFGPDPESAFEHWDEFVGWWGAADPGPGRPIRSRDLGSPVPRPRQVFAIGLNYRGHAAEVGAAIPEHPVVFTKFPTCISGPVTEVAVPDGQLDWEVELVVVMGRVTHRVRAAEAWSCVAGLSVGQDLSDRRLQRLGPVPQQWSLGKSRPGYGPMGPWLVTPDEFADRDDLEIGCSVNGEIMQSSRTSDLIFPVADLVAYLSGIVTLLPGDVIFTGTPAGVAIGRADPPWLQSGDELVTWVTGIGELRQSITSPDT